MTVWVVLVPLLGVLVVTVGLEVWLDGRHGAREVLLRGDPVRARAVVVHHVHVQDSLAG